ncbi:MAG: DNA mismatch repair protein MutL [Candidatus Mesenet longicola]|uniref:DNA mismatch repair protein MutL n=1 Tax=Candidatus Mesenet longicola TaxID=1892558 RepID=A0A8J3HVU9_9RICK|nr:MAG: DNA mismatch repair protein MutL [Candidatus Mesenet longicola]GHM60090.1 MAG: DNA mismatch repair protein MutL [Candidatus Mesenet longicola]
MAIILLDAKTINRIAAGEVIERPASVVKELVENAIDAGSTEIEIKIESGGRNLITVLDDGNGIEKEDIELAFKRHATSKLKNDNDLMEIKHLGFRGEALPSIAAVSRIKLSSRAKGMDSAWSIAYEGGEKVMDLTPSSIAKGTEVEVRDLFFATPNRLKFLKTERAETQAIVDIINNLAMINSSIGFTLSVSNKRLLKYNKQESLLLRLCEIEEEFTENSLKVREEEEGTKITGYICKPTVNRGNSTMIYTFVNNRPIKDNMLIGAIKYAYNDFIPSGRYPIAVLHLEIPYDQVDVNVHPNKLEVRFRDKKLIYEIITRGLIKALSTRLSDKKSDKKDIPLSPFERFIADDKISENSKVNKDNRRNQEFYPKRPSPLESSLMNKFLSPDLETKRDSFSVDKPHSLNLQKELKPITSQQNDDLTKEQINIVKEYPLGLARCQVYNTYIIAQSKDKLIIVDQHAAHERLVYEYLKGVIKKSGVKRQKLLIPETVVINNQAGIELIAKYKDKIGEMGFNLEIASDTLVTVKETPAIFGVINVKETILDLADNLIAMEDTLPIEDKMRKICATISCHGSIRAGRAMKLEEMNAMLRQMEETSFSGQCNHGRPTYIELKLSDIEKLFERR